jgi:putative zinc finger/helix-turn-helix YgiT family protein
MSLKRVEKQKTFREIDVKYWAETYVCDECGISVGTIQQAAAIQNAIADAYREAKGLLTGKEIKRKRKELGWTQKELARKAGVGVVSIKRWENGIIQTKSMNQALKSAFGGERVGNPYTGNRTAISIPSSLLMVISCYLMQSICGMLICLHLTSLAKALLARPMQPYHLVHNLIITANW